MNLYQFRYRFFYFIIVVEIISVTNRKTGVYGEKLTNDYCKNTHQIKTEKNDQTKFTVDKI